MIDGKAEADYETCVDICTKSSLKEMIFPAALGILAPIIVGLVLGCNGVVGMLAGALISGFALAVMMANSGGAWDNAKNISRQVISAVRAAKIIKPPLSAIRSVIRLKILPSVR